MGKRELKPRFILALLGFAIWGLQAQAIAREPVPDDPNTPYSESLLIPPGELPGVDFLQLTEGLETSLGRDYLSSLDVLSHDEATSAIIFPEVPATEEFAQMQLGDLIDVALQGNFDLQNSERSVRIARSQTRSAEADFIPFVDLVGASRYSKSIDRNQTRFDADRARNVNTSRHSTTIRNEGGVESGVNLPTGGRVLLDGSMSRTDTGLKDGSGSSDSRSYNSNAEMRFLQPLLRGGGTEVGTADLRRARISEMNQVISDQLRQRQITLSIISTYFSLLQTARQLEVSRNAIEIRMQTLRDAVERYNVGQVDESEILRAETSYLGELQDAIERRRRLGELREDLLILLGLPLDTPISLVDITPELILRGRVNLPAETIAIDEMRNSRLELMQADLDLALSRLSVSLARNDLLPNLDFDAGYNRNDSSGDASKALGFENEGWDAGGTLRIPLINIQRREAHKRALIGLEQDETSRLSLERDLIQEVLSARRNVAANEIQLVILRKQVEQSRKSLQLITGRFEVGFEQVTEVRIAQDDLFGAETSYNTALLNYQLAIARLYVALGRPLL